MSFEVQKARLGDLLEITSSKRIHMADYVASGIPFYRSKEVIERSKGNKISTELFISHEQFDLIKQKFGSPRDGDILLTSVGTLGVPYVVRGDGDFYFKDGNLTWMRNFTKAISPQFLYYWLTSPQIQQKLDDVSIGSTQKALTISALKSIEIPLPTRETQDGIVEVLEAVSDRISLLRETNTTLETIAQALFKSWFVDFDPVRAKQQGNAPQGMDAATAALFPDSLEESELGEVPKGWKYGSLRDAVTIFDSKRIPLAGQDRAKRQGIYPYYGAAALMDHVDDFLFDGIYLLMGEDGSVADPDGFPITQYVWGKIWVNNHAHVLQGNNGISTELLMLYVKQINVNPYITGAVQAKLSQSNMWRIPFLMPQKEIAVEFGKLIEPLFDKIRHNSDQIKTLTELRDTLLPRLISGQLRLPE
jgi:restriction endonuclease S subunit